MRCYSPGYLKNGNLFYIILRVSPFLVNGWIIFHILSISDREKIEEGVWLIGRGSLVFTRWSLGFNQLVERMRIRHLWVALWGFPIHLWSHKVLMDVGNLLGKSVFMEDTMLLGMDKCCAKILVEIDISHGLPDTVDIVWKGTSFVQLVDYLYLPFRCLNCHETGHLIKQCTVPLRQVFGRDRGGLRGQHRGRNISSSVRVDARWQPSGVPACPVIAIDDRANSPGKIGDSFVPQYEDLSRDVITYIEAIERRPGIHVLSVSSGDSQSVDKVDTPTVIIDDNDSTTSVPCPSAFPGTLDSTYPDSIPVTFPSLDPPLDIPVSPTVPNPTSTNESPGSSIIDLSRSLLDPNVSINDSPQLLASYRDILLTHLPILSNKASSKPGVLPIGAFKHRDVTIRRIKGRARGTAPTFDP